ncbi:MAG: thioredoxin family protein [Alistipes sp.]|nr:thioredoxin family protein [Alistipes sp.]
MPGPAGDHRSRPYSGGILKKKGKPVLVLFGAERCAHCKALHPVLEEALQEEYKDQFAVYFVDVDTNEKLTEALHIGGIPVVVIYRDGEEILRFNGEKDYDDLCDLLERGTCSL